MKLQNIDEKVLDGCAQSMAALIVVILLVIALFSSCKTKEFVYLEKTDTLFVHKTDTVKDIRVKVQRYDSIVHDSVKVTLGDSGKPKEIEHWHTEFVKDYRNDSVDKYKAKCDSLAHKLRDAQKQKEVVIKTNYDGWVAFGGLLLLIVAIFVLIRILPRQ